MTKPLVGLTLMIEEEFLNAAEPLFEGGEVEILEWTFDVGWGDNTPPDWVFELLDFYSRERRLLGHGVSFSPLSAAGSERQKKWLACLKEECALRDYRHISEHFGWMSGGEFYQSSPLPICLSDETVAVGVRNLRRLAETSRKRVGLENLAFAFGTRDVLEQGAFLERLLEPVDGFLLLDLHNLYCQSQNFQIDLNDLLKTYPLERVREIHISGGSWSENRSAGKSKIRRDTHDDAVPEEILTHLPAVLRQCPNTEAVIFERIGSSLTDDLKAGRFRSDFRRLSKIVEAEKK